MSRGILTDEIKDRAKKLLGVELTPTEFHLMPYVQYVLMNNQEIEPRKINSEERKILALWRERDWLEGGASGVAVTKEFWDAMAELLWWGYVVND